MTQVLYNGRTTFSNDSDVAVNYGRSDIWVVKLSSSGILQWQQSLGGSDYDDGASMVEVADSEYIVAGTTSSIDSVVTGNHGSSDYWVVKLGRYSDTAHVGAALIDKSVESWVFIAPNPATKEISVNSTVEMRDITITDLSGKCVYRRTGNKKILNINIAGWPDGVYIVTVNGLISKKFVKQK